MSCYEIPLVVEVNVCMSGYKNGFRHFVSCVRVDLIGAKTFFKPGLEFGVTKYS